MIKNILVAVQFSEGWENQVHWATGFAKRLDAKLWLVHAAEPDPAFIGYEAGPASVTEFVEKRLKEHTKMLEEIAQSVQEGGVAAEARMVTGPTVEVIIEQARALSIDLILVGKRKRGVFSRIFGMNVGVQVNSKAHCPVLFVPIDGEKIEIERGVEDKVERRIAV